MKIFRKITFLVFTICIFTIMVSCGSKKVVYEGEQKNGNLRMTIEYDGKENVSKIITDIEGKDEKGEMTKAMLAVVKEQAEKEKGVTFDSKINDKIVTMTVTHDIDIYLKENKNNEFSNMVNKEGKLPLSKIEENLKNSGLKKK